MDNKNKCPYCGAELQENALYCPFCMRELGKGTAKKKKAKIALAAIIFFVAAALIGAGVFIGSMLLKGSDDKVKETATQAEDVTDATECADGQREELPYKECPIITEYDLMMVRAIYLTAVDDLSGLWDPNAFVLHESVSDDEGDKWEIYENDTFMDGVSVRTCFCEDGREIVTSVTGLATENYSDGIAIAECMISSVYNYTYSNLHQMLTDPEVYPRVEYGPGEGLMSVAELPDPWRSEDMSLEGCYAQLEHEIGPQLLYLEFRTHHSEDGTLYDIIITHTQEL